MKWAIVGSGYIANEFAKGLQEVEDAVLEAVVSRSILSGKAFAEKYGCENVYTSYETMLNEMQLDVVYIAIPNDVHYEYIMSALDKGIAVLSEKPMVDNDKQLQDIIKKAAEKNVFLMEGMWTRCFPAVVEARKWISTGKIGKPLTVHSAFNIKPDIEDWQPWKGGIQHAGGALRDIGIYALAMACMVFPQVPSNVHSCFKSNGEVDESFHMLLEYGKGEVAVLGGAFNQISTPVTEIVGEKGRILIGPEFWHPTTTTLILNDGTQEKYIETYPSTGFQFEIREVEECITRGEKESAKFTLEETKIIADIIESTRKKWGIFYRSDKGVQ